MDNKLPSTFKRLVVTKLSANYREATQIETVDTNEFLQNLEPNEVVVQNHFVGINASDINHSAGRYNPKAKPPFFSGFESLGVIVAKGENVKLQKGTFVAVMGDGSFAEYQKVAEYLVIPLPALNKEYLALLVTGLTSSIALEKQGEMTKGETVLVTAAAGGAGQIAVQLAKLAGNYVIGTCSSDEKVAMLKSLGCDRVINYKKENFGEVLKKEFPKGIDIIYECVGGEFLKICYESLAYKGRLLIIGAITEYKSNSSSNDMSTVMRDVVPTYDLLKKSASVKGFLLTHFSSEFPRHLQQLISLYQQGKLKALVDDKFYGIEGIYDAIDYLHNGKNVGKVIVSLTTKPSSSQL